MMSHRTFSENHDSQNPLPGAGLRETQHVDGILHRMEDLDTE